MKQSHLVAGLIAGLLAGAVFGVYMDTFGMLPMIGKLINKETATAGWILHFIFSLVIGVIFGLTLGRLVKNMSQGILFGLIYGLLWWVLGPLVIMPIWLGADIQLTAAGAKAALPSLPGHLLFGLVLGIVYSLFHRPKK